MTTALTHTTPPPALVAPRRLRDYQVDAIDGVDRDVAEQRHRTAVVLATGLGKTDVIAYLAVREARAGGRVLILAHRSELLDQITARCGMHAPEIVVGRVQAARNTTRHPITVAMAPTMARAARRARMQRPTLVIVDECHHAASDGYLGILRWAGCFDERTDTHTPTPLVGVTATFARGDKRGLGDVFLSVAIERGTVWAIQHGPHPDAPDRSAPVDDAVAARDVADGWTDDGARAARGWLVRPRGKVVVGEHLDLAAAKTSRGDYVADELGEMVAQDVEHIVEAWVEHAEQRVTVAFTPNIESAAALAAAFRAAGVPVGEVYGKTTHGERGRVFAQLERGAIRVLVSVMVTTEGWDCPPVSCVLMARPTKLPGLYAQIVGRGLRPLDPAVHPGHPPKTDCLVLDVVGASRTTKLATLVELVPGAEVDDVELDVQPCPGCGGYTCRRPSAVRLAQDRGMVACSCPCADCGQAPDECRCGETGGRDPDGGRRRLRGRARYAEVDLLGLDEQEPAGSLNWLTSEQGDLFVSVGKRFVVLDEGEGGAWSAASIAQYGPRSTELICEGLSLASTKVQVQRWVDAQEVAGVRVYGRSAPWRSRNEPPTEAQLGQARKLGIVDAEGYTRGALSDLMDVTRASRQLAPQAPVASTWQEAHAAARGPLRLERA